VVALTLVLDQTTTPKVVVAVVLAVLELVATEQTLEMVA
jgi:hypothetical protein